MANNELRTRDLLVGRTVDGRYRCMCIVVYESKVQASLCISVSADGPHAVSVPSLLKATAPDL